MRIGVMTGGGDCPGLNAIIQALVVRSCECGGYEVLGIMDGYAGLLAGEAKALTLKDVEDILDKGGTILGTSRVNPAKKSEDMRKVVENLRKLGIDALIAIGGDDTLGAAFKLYRQGLPVVGVPKTIDNDLSATDYSTGFQTAVEIAADAIARLHTTAKSHKRVIVVEVMGRYAGWITLMAGLAGGAHVILIPEKPFDTEEIVNIVKEREKKGKNYTIIAVAEGAKPEKAEELVTLSREKDQFGHMRLGGIANILEKEIEERTGKETRSVVLGHVQRGGPPNAFDRVLGTRLGIAAFELVKQKKYGYAVCLRGTEIVPTPLENVVEKQKLVPPELFELTNIFNYL